ncbi:GNAT family N-acetyltransferase [Parabacteroides chinchillae]|uniref:N-acetyltransferase domain-containing protein n=1 Tax=Parabacteroides chinchillae TaxID=871327 RepID=A0A8G2F2G7_9BACT|nr:GNAT family N-acetyltransferase [Parabacteroides chinchillae]SEG21860.1 hypothetical protein SAMN05444001_12130 [Parabacteroides chinchillae]
MEYQIVHYPEKHRFETEVDGIKAYVEYRLYDGGLDILHTVVPRPIEGRGIAAALVKHAYDYARSNRLRALATCSYAVVWLNRHPEYKE